MAVKDEKPIKLTKVELKVLFMIAKGLSSQEVADRERVSKRTVDFHLANVYAKYKVSNRVLAIRKAIALGHLPYNVMCVTADRL